MKTLPKAALSVIAVGAALTGGALGASLVGSAGAQTSDSSASASASAAPSDGTARDPSQGGHVANGITETLLTGDTATQVSARPRRRYPTHHRSGRERRRRRDLRGAHDEVGRLPRDRQGQRRLQRRRHRERPRALSRPRFGAAGTNPPPSLRRRPSGDPYMPVPISRSHPPHSPRPPRSPRTKDRTRRRASRASPVSLVPSQWRPPSLLLPPRRRSFRPSEQWPDHCELRE